MWRSIGTRSKWMEQLLRDGRGGGASETCMRPSWAYPTGALPRSTSIRAIRGGPTRPYMRGTITLPQTTTALSGSGAVSLTGSLRPIPSSRRCSFAPSKPPSAGPHTCGNLPHCSGTGYTVHMQGGTVGDSHARNWKREGASSGTSGPRALRALLISIVAPSARPDHARPATVGVYQGPQERMRL